LCDKYAPIRAGTDIAFLGGLINYVLTTERWFREYVMAYTNAATLINEDYTDADELGGLFNGYMPEKKRYEPEMMAWNYQGEPKGASKTHTPLKCRYGRQFWLGAVGLGLVAPAVLQAMRQKRRKQSRVGTILRLALSLAGGFALKWAIVHAGRASAEDVESARHASRPSRNAPGWGPGAESRR